MTKQDSTLYEILLKIFTVLVPFYMIFYNPMYEHPSNPKMKRLRKLVWIGFSVYTLLFLTIYVVKGEII